MKLFATIYTALPIDKLVGEICLDLWHYTKLAEDKYDIQTAGVSLCLEGRSEFLLFGEIHLTLAEVDSWAGQLEKAAISFNIDIHGDEARLMRRYQQ